MPRQLIIAWNKNETSFQNKKRGLHAAVDNREFLFGDFIFNIQKQFGKPGRARAAKILATK